MLVGGVGEWLCVGGEGRTMEIRMTLIRSWRVAVTQLSLDGSLMCLGTHSGHPGVEPGVPAVVQ